MGDSDGGAVGGGDLDTGQVRTVVPVTAAVRCSDGAVDEQVDEARGLAKVTARWWGAVVGEAGASYRSGRC